MPKHRALTPSSHSLCSFSVYPLVTDLLLLRLWLKYLYLPENGQVLSCGSNSFGQLGVPHGPRRCVVPQAIEVRTSLNMPLDHVLLKNFQGITVIPSQTGWVPESWKTVFFWEKLSWGREGCEWKKPQKPSVSPHRLCKFLWNKTIKVIWLIKPLMAFYNSKINNNGNYVRNWSRQKWLTYL